MEQMHARQAESLSYKDTAARGKGTAKNGCATQKMSKE